MIEGPRRLRLLVTAVTLAGAASILGSIVAAVTSTLAPPAPWRLALAAVLVVFGDLAVLYLRFGHQKYSSTWSEASLVFGLVLVPWPWLTIITGPCVALAHVLSGRARVKVVFNAMTMTTATTLAGITSSLAYGGHLVQDTWTRRSWDALFAGTLVFFLVGLVLVSAAIAFSQALPLRTVVLRGVGVKIAVFLGNTVVALALYAMHWTTASLAMVPLFAVLLYLAYRGYLAAAEDRDTWRRLEVASKQFARLQPDRVAFGAAEHALSMFASDTAEVVVRARATDAADRYLVTGAGQRRHERVDAVVFDALAVGPGGLSRVIHEEAEGGPSGQMSLTVALDGVDGQLGVLRLGFGGDVRLSARERNLLVTFARSVATSLENARLFEEMRQQAAQHEYDATHDSLTGLPNRVLLHDRVEQAMHAADREGCTVALLLIDLDHFKTVNDTLGHPAGDRLLVEAAARLRATLRGSDTIARLGGDEFVVLLPRLDRAVDADRVATAVLTALSTPATVGDLRLTIEGSVGVACYPDDARDVDQLLAHADVALYQAKTSRGSYRRYRADRDATSVSRLTLAAELRSALTRDELVLHFQPQFRLSDGAVVGAEALVRWQHPTRGLLLPKEFVGVAEDSGLAHLFTLHVLAKAVEAAAQWRGAGQRLHVAVNLSARNLLDAELADAVDAILRRHRLPADQLVLEITETTMMSDLDVVEATLSRLRVLGVQLSVDDFGTGYSSLAFLKRVAVNELKVDRDFVARMLVSDGDLAIVRATVDLGHGLGLRVVAEGVEDAATLVMLASLGCDAAQGYHLGPPAPSPSAQAATSAGWDALTPSPRARTERTAPPPRRAVSAPGAQLRLLE